MTEPVPSAVAASPLRRISITLTKRRVTVRARLLDDKAPLTCEAIWQSLPIEGDCSHSRYARHQIYTLVPGRFEPPPEYTTVTPFTGDLVYWPVPVQSGGLGPVWAAGQVGGMAGAAGIGPPGDAAGLPAGTKVLMDLGVYYDRNNLLLSPDSGWQPNTVFGVVETGLDDLAAAAIDIWRAGSIGETLRFEAN